MTERAESNRQKVKSFRESVQIAAKKTRKKAEKKLSDTQKINKAKREANAKLKAAEETLRYSGIVYPMTKQLIEVAKRKGEDKTNPKGFARMVKEAEAVEKALKDKEAAKSILAGFKGNSGGMVKSRTGPQDFRKGGMVLNTTNNKRNR